MICKLTGENADFSESCPNYDYDEQEDKTREVLANFNNLTD